ncbi:hypothetical protein [Pseudomonas aeruginosa]|uniref:hypothetical protein n=1 Tax=Pseudomonas aeruginosa TaxID=287 RepID=UPI0033394ED6
MKNSISLVFSIGESLLPQSMVFLEEAGLLETVREHVEQYAFQFKNGAAFLRGKQRSFYDFTEKFTDGPGTTWQEFAVQILTTY